MLKLIQKLGDMHQEKVDYQALACEIFGTDITVEELADRNTADELPFMESSGKYLDCNRKYSGVYSGIQFEYYRFFWLFNSAREKQGCRWSWNGDAFVIHGVSTSQKINVCSDFKLENYKKNGWIKDANIRRHKIWSEKSPLNEKEIELIERILKWLKENDDILYLASYVYVIHLDGQDMGIAFWNPKGPDYTAALKIGIIKTALDDLRQYHIISIYDQ